MQRLGSDTGSLVNHVMSKSSVKPTVGMGATVLHWTDRSPATIIEVREINDGYDIVIQGDKATRVDKNGMSESQDYVYEANPDGPKSTYRWKNDGKGWRATYTNERGRVCYRKNGSGLRTGEREKYHDFSF